MDKLEQIFERYRGLVSDDEQVSARLSSLDRKREKLQRQRAEIYENMATLEVEIRKLLVEESDRLELPDKKEAPRNVEEDGERKQWS